MATISIAEIEDAINYWREKERVSMAEGFSLGPRSRALAHIYGLLIALRASSIASDKLDAYQLESLKFRDFPERKNAT